MSRYFSYSLKHFLLLLFALFSIVVYAASDDNLASPVIVEQSLVSISHSSTEVQVAVTDIPQYFSPYSQIQLDAQYAHLFFDPLVRWSVDATMQQRLIHNWKTVTPGIFRFYLKQDITFHSGNKLTSQDVLWTLEKIRKNPLSREFFFAIDNIEVIDEFTFDIYTQVSENQLLDYLSHFFVLDKLFYEQHKIDTNTSQSIIPIGTKQLVISGTGPYKIRQYNPLLHLRVIRNEHYWDDTVGVSGFNFIKIHSANSRLYALLANDVDISESILKKNIDTVYFAPSKSVVEISSSDAIFFTINNRRSEVFKRGIAREGIMLSINEAGMLKHIVNNLGSTRAQFMPLQEADAEVLNDLQDYDVNRAKYIFSKIKMPSQLSLLVLVDKIGNTSVIANAIINMLQRVGIKVEIKEVKELHQWKELFSEYDFTVSAWKSPLRDNHNVYHNLFNDSALSKYINELFGQQQSDLVLKTKISLYQKFEKENYISPLLFLNRIWASDEKYNLEHIFSINSIPYWHLLKINENQSDSIN